MGQINVDVGGKTYSLACRDGEEARLTQLAAHLDSKARDLSGALGQVSETRMLLMVGILVTDELFELRDSGKPAAGGSDTAALGQLAARIDALASALENSAPTP